jgi:hypothetical protein
MFNLEYEAYEENSAATPEQIMKLGTAGHIKYGKRLLFILMR